MKKTIVLIVLILGVFSCSSTKTNSDKKKGVGVKQKTQNPNTPYIYKNGYLDYKIQPKLTVIENDSTYINELKFILASLIINGFALSELLISFF